MNTKTKIFLLFLVSAALRLFLLGSKSLWIDEFLAWGATRMGWIQMMRHVASGTPHPPGAYFLIKLSTLLAGDGEFGLRFIIALAGASAVIPVYRLASRRTTSSGGFYAALLWAVSPFAVSLGQEVWVYGINAALSLWFADTADSAWRGSKKAYTALFFIGSAGVYTQHLFLFSIAAGCVLYLSVPGEQRISFWKFAVVPAVLTLLYLPVFLYFLPQFMARSQRMARAGITGGISGLFSTDVLSRYFKIISGGLLPDMTANLLERPRMLAAYILNSAVVLLLGVFPFFMGRKWKISGVRWLWIALLLPFGLFLKDQPGIRQLAVLWIPFSITSAAVFSRFRYSGAAVCLLCAAALVPYYMLREFPYHRSNWREAVERVESEAAAGDAVVILGGKSTSFAWEFYSRTSVPVFTPGGNDPFDLEAGRTEADPEDFLDSLAASSSYNRLWIINDQWGGPSLGSFAGEFNLSEVLPAGDRMETGLIDISH